MSPSDLDKWLEEQHRRVLFRYVLEDELIKELTEIVARGDVTCQGKGEDNDKAAVAESENEKWPQVEKEVTLAVRQPYKIDNTFVDAKSQLVNENEKKAKHQSTNKKRSRKMRGNSLDQTVNSRFTCSNSGKNKSPDLSTDENTQSNAEREENETNNSKMLKNPTEPDNTRETTQFNSKRTKKLTPNEEGKKDPSNLDSVEYNTPLTRSRSKMISPGKRNGHNCFKGIISYFKLKN